LVPAIVLEKVSRHFGATAAVDHVDLKVESGEFVTLLGPSGCGKTTTLRMVAGLEQNDTGRIAIGDTTVSDASRGLFVSPDKRKIGMVFQSYAIWPHMTVFSNVAYPLVIRRRPAQEIREKVTRALQLVEMAAFAERPAPLLSGGQQQRVAIARALVFEPQVLLLDEPLSNLDAQLRTQTGDEFRALQKRLGVTTLYVTHDQEEAMALSDRIVVMHRGRALQIAEPDTIYRRPASREVAAFVGSPNLLDARVVSSHGTDRPYTLLVRGEGWQGACLAGESFAENAPVIVMIRPEDIEIRPSSGDGEIGFSGRVANSIFRGARRSLTIEAGSQRLDVEIRASETTPSGDRVAVAVRPASAWAIKP
jgi:iron(III) transport system ATP-binding protein